MSSRAHHSQLSTEISETNGDSGGSQIKRHFLANWHRLPMDIQNVLYEQQEKQRREGVHITVEFPRPHHYQHQTSQFCTTPWTSSYYSPYHATRSPYYPSYTFR